jgi:hypothetical protein
MNEIEKEEFHKTINSIPFWVKNQEDAERYASHLYFRLLQMKKHFHSLTTYLSLFHSEIYEKIQNDPDLIYRDGNDLQREYDKVYNGIESD